MTYRAPEQIRKEQRSEAGLALAAARERSPKLCPTCQKDFLGQSNQKYCSTLCRVKAFTVRKRKALTVTKRKAGVAGANAVED